MNAPARDWETAYPPNGRAASGHFDVNGQTITSFERVDTPPGLSLSQEENTCRVQETAPYFSMAESLALRDGLSQLMQTQAPSLFRKDDTDFDWEIHRVWTDAPAGTDAVNWGVFMMRVGPDLPGTSILLALPRGPAPSS